MASVASLRTFAYSSSVPIVVFVDIQQEYLAKPRLRAISEIDRALDGPSCYSSEPFTALVPQSGGGIGLAGESACLPTMIDAYHRNDKVDYLRDASASHALDDMPADDVHRAVSRISALYGDGYETTDWIASALPRKLGNGKYAGG